MVLGADSDESRGTESAAMGPSVGLRDAVARAALTFSLAFACAGVLAAVFLRPTPTNLLLAVMAALVLSLTLVGAAAVRARGRGVGLARWQPARSDRPAR